MNYQYFAPWVRVSSVESTITGPVWLARFVLQKCFHGQIKGLSVGTNVSVILAQHKILFAMLLSVRISLLEFFLMIYHCKHAAAFQCNYS